MGERKFRISVAHGKMEYLTGTVYSELEAAVAASKTIIDTRAAAYKAGTGRKGQPPVVRLMEVVEEFK